MSGVVVEFVQHSAAQIVLHARARAAKARCPHCSRTSGRVHGRYVRRLADAAIGGRAVVVELLVRRFRCLNGACTAVTFAEQIEGLTTPHARKTPLLRSVLLSIACSLAGRPGARFARLLGIRVAKDTLLHLLRTMPDRREGPVRVLGVDDFALRKGASYATILVDLETRRPIDVLPGREAEPLAAWLARHPEVEIICRDRAGAYAEGARTGAPQAVQVADGWHLWRNLAEAVEKTVGSHHTCIRSAFTTSATTELDTAASGDSPSPLRTGRATASAAVARTRDRYAAVQQRLAEGKSLAAIGRELRLDHSTVRRFARATSIDELLVKAVNRQSILDEYKPYLHQRWNEGCHDIPRLHREVRELGFPGDVQTVRRYLRWSKENGLPVSPRPAPRPRRVVRWIMTGPDRLTAGDALELKEIRAACPHLDVTARHVRDFARLDGPRPGRRSTGSALPDHRPPQGPGRRDRRPVQFLELGPGRGPGHTHQADQEAGLRAGQPRPSPQKDPSRPLTVVAACSRLRPPVSGNGGPLRIDGVDRMLIETDFKCLESHLPTEVLLRCGDRQQPQDPGVGSAFPLADFEVGSEGIRQAHQVVVAVGVIEPRSAKGDGVSDVESLVHRSAVVVRVDGDALQVDPFVARCREKELRSMAVVLSCLPTARRHIQPPVACIRGMNPEHPESGHAILDGPIHTWDLIDDATRECSTEVTEKSRACCGVRHPIMMPEAAAAHRPGSMPA